MILLSLPKLSKRVLWQTFFKIEKEMEFSAEVLQYLSIILVLCVLGLVGYAYIKDLRLCHSIPTMIMEAWSGTCQMSCRQKIVDRSNLGVIEPDQGNSGQGGQGGQTSGRVGQANLTHDETVVGVNRVGQAIANYACVCRSCPCQLMEKLARVCKPVFATYNMLVEKSSTAFVKFIQTTTHTYDNMLTFVDNHGKSPISAQLVKGTGLISSEQNFVFIRKDHPRKRALSAVKPLKDPSTITLGRNKSNDTRNNEGATSTKAASVSDEGKQKPSDDKTKVTVINSSSSEISREIPKTCPKCLENKHVCLKDCPKSKKN